MRFRVVTLNLEHEHKREFIAGFSMEVAGVLSAAGQPPKAEFVAVARRTLTTPGSTQASSMHRDATETDQITGDLLASGGKAGDRAAASRGRLCPYGSPPAPGRQFMRSRKGKRTPSPDQRLFPWAAGG